MSDINELFKSVKAEMPESLRENAWYIVAASSLVACGKPEELTALYTHLTGQETSSLERERISKRLGDVLMKEWTLVGIPLVITAVAALAKAEEGRGLKGQLWSTKQNTQLTPSISARGTAFLQTLYAHNLAPIFSSWGSHTPDFEWLERNIIYGLFLSDHSILNPVEAELVTLCSIMCQGLRAPTLWHLRGTRRLGVSGEEVEAVQRGVEAVAQWAGRGTEGWARVGDVEGEV